MPCKIGIIGIINKARVAHHTFHNLITLLLTSSLFLVPGVFRSQAFYIKKYTVNDGLPASYIISLYQDSYGFLWIGTFNGLSRFDGKQFVNYGYEAGLPHIIVDAVYEDNQHRLWLGTRNGMAQLKGKHCVIYPVDDGQAINYVFGFKEMKDGNLWALTNKGVYQFEKDCWKKIKLYPGFENHDCHNIIESDSGLLINYHHHIVSKKTDGSFQLLGTVSHDDGHPAFGQLYQRDSSLYLNRVDKYFEINGKDSLSLFEEDLHNKNIVNTFKDSHGCFWVYTLKDQLMVSAPGEKQNFSFKMPVQLISHFFEDRDGTVWIAGIDGLYKVRSQIYKNFQQAFSPVLGGHCNVARISENQLLISGENDNLFIAEPGGLKNDFNIHQVKQTASHL
ncbi:MAG TPA: two-component regulator propeller domain-containing protein, partial [Chitinophagaceae bacterium]|nr:two-component regulator propeller domain-containing protein [Chitinophagaceae bacterium]